MKLLKTILAAVDFDDTSDALLAGVIKLAKSFGSEVVLLHVVEPAELASSTGSLLNAAINAQLEGMRSQLAGEGITVSGIVRPSGRAVSEITSTAEQLDVNLIVMGTRGIAADPHFPLGTTTEKVIRRAARPVLAVQPDRPLDFSNILCPIDFSDTSALGLTNAIRLARAFRGMLHVLTVIPAPTRYHRLDLAWAQWAITAEAQAARQCVRDLNEFLDRFDFRDVDWEKHIERGDPAHRIVACARSFNSNLIVMGSVGRTGLPYMFMGSTAVKVARELPCSLLIGRKRQVLAAELEKNIADIQTAFRDGESLLAQGFCQEALTQFDRCLELDPHFAHAFGAKAEVLERLGRAEHAQECRKLADLVRRELWEQRVQASVRSSHPLFGHHRRFE